MNNNKAKKRAYQSPEMSVILIQPGTTQMLCGSFLGGHTGGESGGDLGDGGGNGHTGGESGGGMGDAKQGWFDTDAWSRDKDGNL